MGMCDYYIHEEAQGSRRKKQKEANIIMERMYLNVICIMMVLEKY